MSHFKIAAVLIIMVSVVSKKKNSGCRFWKAELYHIGSVICCIGVIPVLLYYTDDSQIW